MIEDNNKALFVTNQGAFKDIVIKGKPKHTPDGFKGKKFIVMEIDSKYEDVKKASQSLNKPKRTKKVNDE